MPQTAQAPTNRNGIGLDHQRGIFMRTPEGEMTLSFYRIPIRRRINAFGTNARNTSRCEHTEVQQLQKPGHRLFMPL